MCVELEIMIQDNSCVYVVYMYAGVCVYVCKCVCGVMYMCWVMFSLFKLAQECYSM